MLKNLLFFQVCGQMERRQINMERMIKIGAIIQARMNSSRLKGKIQKELNSKTVLEHVYFRTMQSLLQMQKPTEENLYAHFEHGRNRRSARIRSPLYYSRHDLSRAALNRAYRQKKICDRFVFPVRRRSLTEIRFPQINQSQNRPKERSISIPFFCNCIAALS